MKGNIESYTKRDDELVIAHLSDLHIGLKQAEDRLEKVYEAIEYLKPDVILLTGDIIDSPTDKNAKLAAKVVGNLEKKCQNRVFLVYGNHDRFLKGNRIFGWLRGSSRIVEALPSHAATPRKDIVIEIEKDTAIKEIRVGLLGIDSAVKGPHLAQGYIEPEQLSEFAKDAHRLAKCCDILIAFLHHHPIRIAEVEKSPIDEASLTLVNSAQFLRVLCRARVDILLHGHHHHKRLCWYGESDYREGYHFPVLVLGAGSVVGAKSFCCEEERASFNTIHVTKTKKYRVGFIYWNKTSMFWEYDLFCVKQADEEFEDRYKELEREFGEGGVYKKWTPPDNYQTDVSAEDLIRIGFQKLLYLSLHICPMAYSANLWVCHSCDEDGRPKFLRSVDREGPFPMDQLTQTGIERLRYRPHEIVYNEDSMQDMTVAARSVVEHDIVILNPDKTNYDSRIEKKIGTNLIVGIPLNSDEHCKVNKGAPLTITIDMRLDKEPSLYFQRRLRERAEKLRILFRQLSDFRATTISHQNDYEGQ